VPRAEVIRGFEHVSAIARKIIEHGRDWNLFCDRNPILNWVDGRVTLLGDAAHSTLQYMGQGACMAMADAICLSHEVATRSKV
jgi:salicylate hydroxylase